jgi:hypothetical protein
MNPRRFLSLIVVFAALAGMLVVTGCGSEKSAKDSALEMAHKAATGKDIDVKTDGNTVKLRGEDMQTDMTETSEWPAGMFPDVPKFTFGKIERVVEADEGGMHKFNIYLRDIEDGAAERYMGLMKQRGWSANQMAMGAKGGLVTGEKENLAINFAYSAEKKTGMLVAYSQPAQ